MKCNLVPVSLVVGTALAGCGGSSGTNSSGSTPGTGSQVSSAGDAKFTYSGSVRPGIFTGENGITVTSLAGATITAFAVNPPQTNANSVIAYGSFEGTLYEYQNGITQIILDGLFQNTGFYRFGHDGHIYFSTQLPDQSYRLERCNYDGTGITSLYTASNYIVSFDYAANGSKFVIGVENDGLFTLNSNGTSPTSFAVDAAMPAISADSTRVAYVKQVGSYNQIFVQPLAGGTQTQLTKDSVNHAYPAWSPDGTQVFSDIDTGSVRYIGSYVASGPAAGAVFDPNVTSNAPWSSLISFSPDGKYFSCEQASAYTPVDQSNLPNVVISDSGGLNVQSLGQGFEPAWSPFFSNRTFVGSSALLFPTSAGFVFSEFQNTFASLAAFTATTPAKATATLESPTGGTGPVVYDLKADTITALKYVNGYNSTPVSLTPNTTDVLLTVDGTNGQVTSVAPFLAARGATPLHVAGSLTYTARFTGVYGAHGKNLAPNGASQIALDARHGTVIVVR